MAGRPVSLAPRPPLLAGREELLARLDARLAGGAGGGPSIIALHGLGGAGKTSVAVEYAHRRQAAAGVVWQFPAEDRAVLAAEFARLAAQLGVGGGPLDPRDPVASVHAVLAAAAEPWLLLFDNAPDRDSVRAFVPPTGSGLVLITSQSALWPPGQSVEVPVLDVGAAAGFLTARSGDPDERAARELAAELDGLPLALEQAAAYVHATGDSLAGYLASFRQRRADLLARGEPAGYVKTVASTWALAFTRLESAAPGAVGLLRLLAFCAPDAVPLRLLLQPRPELAGRLDAEVAPVLAPLLEDPLAASDAIAALRRYSLVTPAAAGSVSVHRLVQAVTAHQMPADLAGQWRRTTAALVGAAVPAQPWMPGTWPTYAILLPHVQAAAPADSAAAAAIADYLGQSGSYPIARNSMKRVVEARERAYGPEHRDTLIARGGLAHWTALGGDAAAARDQSAALVPVAERVLGPEHRDTLFLRRELAWWTGEAGDAAAARDQSAALVPIVERVFGPEHGETLPVRQSLAAFTGRAGDPAAARDQSAALLPVYERVLGPEHPGTLGIRGNLAGWTGQAGDPAAARRLSAALLPVYERVFGPEHPGTLKSRRDVANWTGEAGDAAAARDQLAELLPVYERVLGAQHPETLATRDALAGWTGHAGDAAGARDQFAALLPVRERVLGPEHPDTLTTRHDLAYWTAEAGDAAGARDQFAALLPIRERVQGPEHPDTLTTRAHLARWTGHAGDAAGARDQAAALLPVRERVLGPGHPSALITRHDLAYWTGQAGDAAGARDQFAALLPVVERVLGPEHPHTLATRDNLAYWTRQADAGSRSDVKQI
jgi:Tetratricopeptide repeat